jgi:hypothetical protein
MMTFQPDIIVSGPDGLTLVVDAETSLPNLEQTEEQLVRYMLGMHCPAGILVTPNRMRLYRDLYASPPSVELVGEFDTQVLWRQRPPEDASSFELFVQQWLENLAQLPTKDLPRNVAEALREYILPAVTSGEVHAAHPRFV